MSRINPWAERVQRWTPEEIAEAKRMRAEKTPYRVIADRLAELGYPPRHEMHVERKCRQVST